MTIRNRPIGEYSEQEIMVRPMKDAGKDDFKPFKLTATLKRRALKRPLKNQKPRSNRGVVNAGPEGDG
jgi:hypothetical protein